MSLEMQSMTGGQKKILAVLGLLIAGVVVHVFVVGPMDERAAAASSEAAKLNAETDRRIRMVKRILPMREEIAALDAMIGPVTNSYVLHRELGSYPVQRKIYDYAPSSGLRVVRFNESGRKRISDPVYAKTVSGAGRSAKARTPPAPCYDRYQAEVELQGGYGAIMAFLGMIEAENPFFTVVSLEIVGDQRTPEVHDAQMTLEWPVDAPPPPPPAPSKGR